VLAALCPQIIRTHRPERRAAVGHADFHDDRQYEQ